MKIDKPSNSWVINILDEIALTRLHQNAARPFRENLIWLEQAQRLESKFSNPLFKTKREGWKSGEATARMLASFKA